MISVDALAVEFNGETLFANVSFAINENDKIALMGKNGAGKSTMMKIIAGEQKPTSGNVRCPKEAVIAYLPQHLLTDDNCTVFEETAKAFRHIFAMRDEIDFLNKQLETRTDYESDEYMKIIEKPKKTKTGQYATGEDELQKLMGKHDIIPKILEYRSVRKLKSTYVDALPELVSPKTGRIHTSYMQTVASTGRLSSTNPNLQNIPIRTQMGREIRKAFIAKNDDFTLLAADYSQIELRIIAALSGDENMQKAFVNKEDIHAATAAKVFGVALADVDREMRSKAKAVNFGIIYGQSSFGLAQNLNISRGEAKEIIDAYFAQYPKIKEYMDGNIDFAKEHGYVETILHRRRYLKDINSANAIVRGHAERNAINAPIQGSAADVIKIAMINIFEEFKKQQFQSKMLLQVHDELVFDVFKPELETIKTIVKDKMENAVKLSVPLEVEMNSAKNWLEAH